MPDNLTQPSQVTFPATPATAQALAEAAAHVQLLVLDVDGTMTDGALHYTADGELMKRFHVRDGMGIVLWHRAGGRTAFLTSDPSEIITTRAAKLGIGYVLRSVRNKSLALKELSAQISIPLEAMAYVGDDVNDTAAMNLCGFRACPADAVEAIKRIAQFQSHSNGGNGAVREIIEFLLLSQNKAITLPDEF
jgi:3-deoxy-D-manno-octulosonate 8-phosphate phosphatase (KDO 8-P phosphatase)